MRKLLSLTLLSMVALCTWAGEKTDLIPGSLTLTVDYVPQVLECESGAAWLVNLKDEGDGPQCKSGKGGVVTKTSIGIVKTVTITWGSKSNEDVVVYGSHEPFTDPASISGTEVGTVVFVKNGTSRLDIDGEWEYIGMTATNKVGKACAFNSIEVTWESTVAEPEADLQDGLVINEVCGNDGTATDGSEDWIEIANATNHTISYNLIKLVKVNEDGTEDLLYTTPVTEDVKELKSGEYMLFKRTVHFETGISNSKNIIIKLISAKDKVLSKFDKRVALTDNGHHNAGGSYSRIPDLLGEWAAVENATPGTENDGTPIAAKWETFWDVGSEDALKDGMKFVVACYDESKIDDSDATNNEPLPAFVMSSSWGTTKDGGIFQLAETATIFRCNSLSAHLVESVKCDANRVAVLTLENVGNGKWAIKFGETNNYQNDGLYLACTVFKNLDFKKSIDKKGVACTITFDERGYADISYGEQAGSLLFNYKGDGTDRFLNYDPTDKPEEHQAVRIYGYQEEFPVGICSVHVDNTNGIIYNLNGQRVNKLANGMFIKGGKKLIVK